MNFIRHLLNAFARIDQEPKLKSLHISLYISLFRIWNENKFSNPVTVIRKNLMQMSKIGSANTYTRVLKELELYGFIRYHPSHDPVKGSKVYMYIFDTSTCIKSDTRVVSEVIPFYKHINNIYSIEEEENYSNLKNEDMNDKKKNIFQVPSLEHIQIYFEQKGHPKTEAERFFNYYESNGWLVGGKTKMKDWKAAARNWMLNIKNYQSSTPNKTASPKKPTTNQRKQFSGNNYQEPL